MTTLETKTILEAYTKEIDPGYQLVISSSRETEKDYFLANIPVFATGEQFDFCLVKKDTIKATITLAFTDDGEAISLPGVPFGGFWIKEQFGSEILDIFIKSVLKELGTRGISRLKLHQAPKPYEATVDQINYLLFKNGFQLDSVLSHQFLIGRKKIKKLIQKSNPKIQSKIKALNLKSTHGSISSFGFLEQIKNWNQQRGYQVNYDEKRLIQQVSEFPDRYFLIQIYERGNAVGLCLAVKLTSNSLYYFLSAFDPKSTLKLGGELILNELFLLANEQKVDFIDLGSSDLVDKANHSLIFFKSRFSNDISNKTTWSRDIEMV